MKSLKECMIELIEKMIEEAEREDVKEEFRKMLENIKKD